MSPIFRAAIAQGKPTGGDFSLYPTAIDLRMGYSPAMLDIKIRNGLPFPVVGLGYSCDDPGALLEYIAGRDPHTGMAYIVMQPRASAADSSPADLTPEFLALHTQLPVTEMSDDMSLEPDHVYVMPRLRRDTGRRGGRAA